MKLKTILLAVGTFAVLSCNKYDIYVDKIDTENEEEIYQIVHNDVIASSFRRSEIQQTVQHKPDVQHKYRINPYLCSHGNN